MSTLVHEIHLPINSDNEMQAQKFAKRGEIDEALTIYQRLKPASARILRIIGALYAHKKGDYGSAVTYYKQALQIQDENGEDTSDILTDLGFVYQNLCEFDVALIYHFRALSIRTLTPSIDQRLVAISLFGISNAYWGKQNLSEALCYAQQALTLNESIGSANESNIAANLAILANIYHSSGDDIRALEVATQALILFERCVPPDSSSLIPLLNNIGTMQFVVGLFNDALLTFVRVLHICEKTLPEGHPQRVKFESNIRRITDMQQYIDVNSFSHFWKLLSKLLL